jgi:hypothetical protein
MSDITSIRCALLQMRDAKLRTDIALSMAENLSPGTKDRVIAAIQKCSSADDGMYSGQQSGSENKNMVLAWMQKFSNVGEDTHTGYSGVQMLFRFCLDPAPNSGSPRTYPQATYFRCLLLFASSFYSKFYFHTKSGEC